MFHARMYHPGGAFQEDYWSSDRNNFNQNNYGCNNRKRNLTRNNNYSRHYTNFHDLSGTIWELATNSNQFNHYNAPCFKRRKFSASSWGETGGNYLPLPTTYDSLSSSCNTSVALSRSNADVSTSTGSKYVSPKMNDEDGEVIFMSREDIERSSPSRKDGIDAIRETYLRYSYCAFIQDLGMRLELPQTTIGTSMVLCHRFFLRRSHACHDRFLVATAALFLAAKSEETPRPLNNVLRVSCEILHKQDINYLSYRLPVDWFEQYRERVLEAEQMILTTLNFELNVQHPYAPLTSVLRKLGLSQSDLVNVALNLISEGLRSSLWLQFKPHHIAAGAAYLAAKMLHMDLPLYHKISQEFQTTPAILQDVAQQLMELF